MTQTITVDQAGRITLPKQILESLDLQPDSELVVEVVGTEIVIKPKNFATPLTDRVAALNLPVADWTQMEQEIDAGRLE